MATYEELEQQRLNAMREGSPEEFRLSELQRALQKFGPSLTDRSATDYDVEAGKTMDESYARLNEILSGSPNVDFEGMAKPFLERLRARPAMKRPGRLEAFAAGFGSQEGAQSV